MKSTNVVLIIVAIILIGGGAYWYSQSHSAASSMATSTAMTDATTTAPAQTAPATTGTGVTVTTTTVTTTPTPATPSTPAAAPSVENFTVNGNDETADVMTINVHKGDTINITFGADAGTTYHGGLDFRSSVVNTGTITPGSTKTITFTANQSFAFTPYWPATNIAKPYTIKVVVS